MDVGATFARRSVLHGNLPHQGRITRHSLTQSLSQSLAMLLSRCHGVLTCMPFICCSAACAPAAPFKCCWPARPAAMRRTQQPTNTTNGSLRNKHKNPPIPAAARRLLCNPFSPARHLHFLPTRVLPGAFTATTIRITSTARQSSNVHAHAQLPSGVLPLPAGPARPICPCPCPCPCSCTPLPLDFETNQRHNDHQPHPTHATPTACA